MEVIYATNTINDFINSLDKETRARTVRLIGLLSTYGNELRLPHSRAIGSGLFELRLNGKHQVRLIYCYVGDNSAYIVHSLIKKTGALLKSDIDYAQTVRDSLIASI